MTKMEGETKKISFGFTKLMKKPIMKPEEEKKQYIECLEGKSIKIMGGEISEEKKLLVIPLKDKSRTASTLARIARGEEDLTTNSEVPETTDPLPEPIQNESIDKMAEREILDDLKKKTVAKTNSNLVVPMADKIKLTGENESTLEDYENIPVVDFGMAMLRGMGWQPGKGMGKHSKSSELVLPNLRPKGMGLGADKESSVSENCKPNPKDEELKVVKGAFVKIIAGKQNGAYGEINGFDEDSARLIVKTAIGGSNINLSEFMVQVISKDEYQKMSKVINSVKYEEYKNRELQNAGNQEKKPSNNREDRLREGHSSSQGLEKNHARDDYDNRDRYTQRQVSSKSYKDSEISDRRGNRQNKESEKDKYASSNSSSSPDRRKGKDLDKKRKGKKKRRDRSRSRERRRH